VGLLFFLTVMVILGATRGPNLHPMHYWFIACAFFAFHLLLAYLVDQVAVNVAFAVSAATSLALVVSYLRLVTGMRHALFQAGATQFVFLVLFSYAFFFEGVTGLAITVGAIVTLFILMQVTARVSWEDVFAGGGLQTPATPEAGHGR
jgi:inner membrane protein involved in colicin E2 resistance